MRAVVGEFLSENGYDFLKLRDCGPGAPVLADLTGSSALPVDLVTPNALSQLTLDWISDFSNTYPGWNALTFCEPAILADDFEGRDLARWSLAAP